MSSNSLSFDADDDFGHIVRRCPRRVCVPASIDELADIVRRAHAARIPVCARGHGHSVFGQSQVEDGWLLDMRQLHEIAIRDGFVDVEAGASWGDIVRVSDPHRLAPPVLNDYAGLSIGGTLSMGGVGACSFSFGLQADCVEALTIVTGTGEVRRCSMQRDRELFENALAGLGQVGIIARATIPLRHVSAHVRHYRITYTTLEALLDDMDRMVTEARFEQLSAVGLVDAHHVWHFHIDAVEPIEAELARQDVDLLAGLSEAVSSIDIAEFSRLDYTTRLNDVVASWTLSGLWQAPHPWVDVFIPAARLRTFARTTIDSLTPVTLGVDGAMVLIYPIVTKGTAPRLPLVRNERMYLFDVLRCVPGASNAEIETLLSENRRIHEHARSVGGCMYPIGAVPMSSADWRRHFGAGWSAFADAKRRYDPANILGRGCGIFR
jgi:cytokinin dehydrogenase